MPLLFPVAVGLKANLLVQDCPLVSVVAVLQAPPLTSVKSPGLALALVIPRPLIVSVPAPVLLSVRVFAALWLPSVRAGRWPSVGGAEGNGVVLADGSLPLPLRG